MSLGQYQQKRQFDQTPEPKESSSPTKPHPLRFVVQEHHARALHYDFRLELDGVLKSWAIPKGPSLNPHEHHLAVQTEDHPYSYRTFEGVIPKGNYGAGNVIVWDEGWYEPRVHNDRAAETTLRSELKNGHLTFVLHGRKLRGEFALIKLKNGDDQRDWLLIKKADSYASTHASLDETSIKSHRRVDELGLPSLDAWPKKAAPWQVEPMLCTLVEKPFDKEDWLFEIKWDGYRAIAATHQDRCALYSRNHLDFSDKYPSVIEALHQLKHDVVLDGEIVSMDKDGVPHFEWLQDWSRDPQGVLRYCVFDILWCDGHDLREMPLRGRKAVLRSVLPNSNTFQYSDDVEAKGVDLFKLVRRRGLEGIVAKRADSPYREDERGMDWQKIKTQERQEVVIGGYTEPRGSRKYLGSLLVGVYDHGKLIYVGHSGGGIPDEKRRALRDGLAGLEQATSPFGIEPKPNAPVHWVKPRLVAEMAFSQWTAEGSMRHPEFKGLRPDKKPLDVHREIAGRQKATNQSAADPSGLPFEPTHLDKVFFPKRHYTKGDLFKYYETIAPFMLPYLKDRPLSLNRMPNGIKGESFFQKNNEHLPDWVPNADIFSESNGTSLHWIVGGRLETLLYIVQLGSIEINPWNSRIGTLDKPDWIVIDLDPEGLGFEKVIAVARTVKEVGDDWGVPTYPKTSGKTGMHIFIPMQAKYSYDQAKNLAHLMALEIHARQPRLTSVERLPEKRKHKIYLDFLQNREGQTLAAAYSVRPTPEASVSMPLHWDEVKPGLKPTDFTIQNAEHRLRRTGDLWKPVTGKGVDLPSILKKISI